MRPSVVICGSYHRDPQGLRRVFRELEATGCRILSPLTLDFTNPDTQVVRGKSEADFTAGELEKYHLRAITEADLLWLYAPEGYVGTSGSFELGYAIAGHKPVFCNVLPEDEMLQNYVHRVGSVFEALEIISLNA